MQVADIKEFAERRPFRPFSVWLNNGASYLFKEPRSLGAPKDYHVLFFFGDSEFALIETDSIVEVLPQ
ncbi:MAG TPA: hypothetical protein PKE47_00270 [Verrucomicrobiota bacterium]|nr:hypothetical protein [Verrucomicrobiota bacterium]